MIDWVPFQISHLMQMKLKDCHANEVAHTRDLHQATAETLFLRGEPVAIFGAREWIPGVWHIWGLLSNLSGKYPLSFHKQILESIEPRAKALEARRFQMSVREDFVQGRRWARALGFKCEGLMSKYGPDGTSYYLYARCFE